jgi:hypothetical protein
LRLNAIKEFPSGKMAAGAMPAVSIWRDTGREVRQKTVKAVGTLPRLFCWTANGHPGFFVWS